MPDTIVVTGASGFVGSALMQKLALQPGRGVHGCFRAAPLAPSAAATTVTGEVDGTTDWRPALRDADAVVHTAAHAHQLGATSETDYHRVNVEGTLNLARQAAESGVRRFIFLSSIKVNGEGAPPEHPYRETDPPAPEDPYGRSKLAAEQGLAELARDVSMEVVVLRPPLVYGPGAKGNLARLLGFIERGIPLPLGMVRNRRSMIALGNLCDAVVACLDAPAAAGQTFLLADREDLSTPVLVRRLAQGMGKGALLVPVPEAVLRVAGRLTGRSAEVDRLVGSLCVDGSAITRRIAWEPSAETAAADLAAMAASFASSRSRQG